MLVKQLADARLVVTSRNQSNQETVEVVHEALIRNWGELREWMNTNRVFRTWQERLRASKRQWEATNKDSGSLLRGAALAEAEEKLKERPADLIDEKEFIEQSLVEVEQVKQAQEEQRQKELETAKKLAQAQKKALEESKKREDEQKKSNKKLFLGSIVLSILFLGATGLAWLALNEKNQAELNQAESLSQNSLSLLDEHEELEAAVKAIQAGKILHSHDVSNSVTNPNVLTALEVVRFQLKERNRLEGHSSYVFSVSFSPDGKTLASGSADATIKIWDVSGLDLDSLMQRNCDSVRAYLENNPNVKDEDRQLCDGFYTQQ